MKLNLIQVGTMAIALTFSAAVSAQVRVMEKPRESVRDSLKGSSLDTTIKSTTGGTNMKFDASALNKPTIAGKPQKANDNNVQCNGGPLNAGEIFNKISGNAPDITLSQVQDLVSGGYLTRGICEKPLETLNADALANAIRIAKEVKNCLSGQSPVNHPKSDECHVQANKTVFGFSDAEATENATALKKCAYNGEQAAL